MKYPVFFRIFHYTLRLTYLPLLFDANFIFILHMDTGGD